jgi:putative ABC transport system permease protein
MSSVEKWVLDFLERPANIVVLNLGLLLLIVALIYHKQVGFIWKSLRRNLLRTTLTSLATMVLVFVITLVWTVLWFLDLVTAEKSKNLKAIVTEKWQIPSQMPPSYEHALSEGAASKAGDIKPEDYMTWSFYGGSLEADPEKRTRENLVFFFVMDPKKLPTMMDGLDELSADQLKDLNAAIKLMDEDPRRVVLGKERLAALNKKVGERISLYSINFKDINLDGLEIIGVFPEGRYDQSAVMHRDLLDRALDSYKTGHNNTPHPMADKSLNLVWLRVPDTRAYEKVADQIMNSSLFKTPAVKCETASSGVASFLDAYRDLIWGMRYLMVPAILITMALVIANAISISVRERRTELAVLKVLGFSPRQLLCIVLGEALLIGCVSGLLSAGLTYLYIDVVKGGIAFPIAFFPKFLIPAQALWWGPLLGGLTALAGSIIPAYYASSVKVNEVFSKIA